jgi:hypothetical protein
VAHSPSNPFRSTLQGDLPTTFGLSKRFLATQKCSQVTSKSATLGGVRGESLYLAARGRTLSAIAAEWSRDLDTMGAPSE